MADQLKRSRDRASMFAGLRQRRNQEAEAQEDDLSELIGHKLRSSVRLVQLSLSIVLIVNASRQGAEALPLWQSWSGDEAPIVLFHNAPGHLVGIDPYDALDNSNAFVAGSSGSGKSSLTNSILINSLAIRMFGGSYYEIHLGADCSLNPFFAHEDLLSTHGDFDDQRLQFLVTVIERMVCDAPGVGPGRNET